MSIKLVNNIVTIDRFQLLEEKINNLYNPVLLSMLRKGDIELTDIDKKFWNEDMILAYLQYKPSFIHEIKEPTEDMYITAIDYGNPYRVFEFNNPTEKMYMHAVTKDPDILKDIEDQTDKICYCAIAMDPESIKYVKNKTEHMCLSVVRRDGMLIRYIEDPTDNVIEEAIKENGSCIQYIHDSKWNFGLFIDAIKSDPYSIRYFYNRIDCCENENISMDFLIKSALYLDAYVFNYCDFFTLPDYRKYAKCAILSDPNVYASMPSVVNTEELDKFACRVNANSINYVGNYTMDVIIEAFRTNADIASNCWARQAYPIKFLFAELYVKLEMLHKFSNFISYKE